MPVSSICTVSSVALNNGANGSGTQKRMQSGAGEFLNAWGDGSAVVVVDDRLVALSPFARTVGAAPAGRCRHEAAATR